MSAAVALCGCAGGGVTLLDAESESNSSSNEDALSDSSVGQYEGFEKLNSSKRSEERRKKEGKAMKKQKIETLSVTELEKLALEGAEAF